MTYLESIFARLERAPNMAVLREVRDGQFVSVSGAELLHLVAQARKYLVARGLKQGARCALLAPNSIRWVALDLALMAEGIIVVPLDPRQVPREILAVIEDSTPSLLFCSDSSFSSNIPCGNPAACQTVHFDEVFESLPEPSPSSPPLRHANQEPVTIVYTSGTSGEPKGVVLNAGNITFMLGATNARLDQLMGARQQPESVFQYAPFCFAAARILLLTSLSRNSVLTLSTDLTKIADELKITAPDYFVNVPLFLERIRRRVEESLRKRGRLSAGLYEMARGGYFRQHNGETRLLGLLSLWLARRMIFPAIRTSIGPNLKVLICGSAPLSAETQLFFMMIGLPVLQVYGLTETTAICTMDEPGCVDPGRVGRAIPGVEMTVAENGEILVRGPNIFPGYWQRPAETAKALSGGWFHTGDLGDVDRRGNWRITGRLKNLIILNSGHNIAPEPIEEAIAARLPEAQQVMLLGNQRSSLAAIVTFVGTNGAANGLNQDRVQAVLDSVNKMMPHYKQVRAFHIVPEPFSIENGLLTPNGKLKRDAIAASLAAEIAKLDRKRPA